GRLTRNLIYSTKPLKASLSVAFKGGLFLHKMQVLLLHLNPRRDRGFLSPPWTAHKVQQLFLHLVKRLPTIAAIVYSKLLQFCGDDRHKWP
ncbi:hypothetical protein ACGGP5_005279, partial [Klebsiella pneumoniae]